MYSPGLAVQLVRVIAADIWEVYSADVLCIAAPHLQQPLWTMKMRYVGLHTAQSGWWGSADEREL